MKKYKAIIDLIRREDVTLFVGSGCSIASEAPSAKELTDKLWALLEPDYQDNDISNVVLYVKDKVSFFFMEKSHINIRVKVENENQLVF